MGGESTRDSAASRTTSGGPELSTSKTAAKECVRPDRTGEGRIHHYIIPGLGGASFFGFLGCSIVRKIKERRETERGYQV